MNCDQTCRESESDGRRLLIRDLSRRILLGHERLSMVDVDFVGTRLMTDLAHLWQM